MSEDRCSLYFPEDNTICDEPAGHDNGAHTAVVMAGRASKGGSNPGPKPESRPADPATTDGPSREMTAEELVAAAEKLDVVDGAILIPALWPRLILERSLPSAPDHRLREAMEDLIYEARFADKTPQRDAAINRGLAVLSEATPSSEPDLDVERAWTAMSTVDRSQKAGNRREWCEMVAAEYARLSASQTPEPDIK